jgi:hypothetical protein
LSLDEVIALERLLLAPLSAPEADALLHPDFREFGASGGEWDRDAAIEEVASRSGALPEPSGMEAAEVAPGVVLVTYSTSRSLRSSLWVRDEAGWRIIFHQGTPAA